MSLVESDSDVTSTTGNSQPFISRATRSVSQKMGSKLKKGGTFESHSQGSHTKQQRFYLNDRGFQQLIARSFYFKFRTTAVPVFMLRILTLTLFHLYVTSMMSCKQLTDIVYSRTSTSSYSTYLILGF